MHILLAVLGNSRADDKIINKEIVSFLIEYCLFSQ